MDLVDSPRLDALVERVKQLERENRRLKWAGIVSVLTLGTATAAVAVGRGGVSQVIRAVGFVAVDERGQEVIRIRLGGQTQGRGLIEFLDKNGKIPMAIGLGADGSPFMMLADSDGQERLDINALPKKGIGITFQNPKRDAGLLLSINPEGVAALGFVAQGGNHVLDLGVNPDGSAIIKMRDTNGRVLFAAPQP
jgi:hypothetical protein